MLYPFCRIPCNKGDAEWGIIVLLWFDIMHYSNLFHQSTMIPTLIEKSEYLVHLTGKPMHSASKERNGSTHPNYSNCLKSKVSITFYCQVCSTHYTAAPVYSPAPNHSLFDKSTKLFIGIVACAPSFFRRGGT